MRDEHAYYCYGIEGFENYSNGYDKPQNPDLITMKYGGGKKYVFHKNACYDLMKSIYGEKYFISMLGVTKEMFEKAVKKDGLLKVMNANLKGRGFMMVTDFASYHEYSNGGQNKVLGITGVGLSGKTFAEKEEDLFNDKATCDEMYNYKPNDGASK